MLRQITELESLDMSEGLACSPGISGIAARVPTLMNTFSPVSTRVPPSLRVTSTVFGATKRADPMINSAPAAS
jgi:hypothetical protein